MKPAKGIRNSVGLGAMLLLSVCCYGQNFTAVSASNIQDLNGNKLAAGQLCFQATDSSSSPISFQAGGGGQVITTARCAAVTTGAIGSFQVPNPVNTSPAGIFYTVSVYSGSSNPPVSKALLQYKLVQFSGATFNFDSYTPTGGVVVPVTGQAVTGNFGVNGNLAVTGSCTGCGTGSLGNASTVVDISTVSGADFCAKAQTGNNALPAAGGVLDGRGLTGAQACAAPGLQLSPNVQLLFGATTLTEGAGVGIGLAAHDSIIGLGSDANNGTAMSVITGNGTSPMIYQTDPGTDADNITISGMNVGNLSDVQADWPWNMAVYLPQATWLTFEQNHVYAAYGLYYGSHSAQRPDITSYTGCDCYSHIDHNLIQGFVEGLVLGDGANSNAIDHNEFGSFQDGGGIYVSVAAFTNHFSGVDCETINYCMDVYGQDTAIKDAYIEGAGLRGDAPAFANSTAYLAGQVITDGTNEEMVVVGGTSASSGTPSWPTTPDGAKTVSGTATFQLVLNASIILQAQSNLTTFIGSVASTAGAPGMLTTMMPAFFTEQSHYYAQAPYVVWGQQVGLNGQTFTGGLDTLKTTLAAAPTLAYHLAGGTHTTTYYYYANLNTVNGATGLSPQANITSAPDALGVVETATVGNPGTGCTTGERITLQVNTEGTEPVLTVAQTGGAATSFTIYNGGTVIPPGTYPIDTTTGHCSGTTAIVDSNYVVITPPQVTFNSVTSAWQFPGAKLSGWDIVGHTNSTFYTIGDSNYGANLGPGSFCHPPISGPAWSLIGSFCDYGSTHAAYIAPTGNSTGDAVIAGNVTVGAMSGNSGNCAEYGTGGILQAAAAACGSGTVTSSGSPASGNIAKFTTATNVAPAAYGNIVALWASGSCSGFLKNDGTCGSGGGGGSPTSSYWIFGDTSQARNPPANNMWYGPIFIGASISSVSNMTIMPYAYDANTSDVYSWGIYTLAGVAVCHTAAHSVVSSGDGTQPCSEGTVSIAAGLYIVAIGGNSAALSYYASGLAPWSPYQGYLGTNITGGQVPASFSPVTSSSPQANSAAFSFWVH